MGLLDSRHRPLLLACFLPFARTNCSLATQQLYVVLLCCSRCVPADEETTIKNVTVHVLLWTVLVPPNSSQHLPVVSLLVDVSRTPSVDWPVEENSKSYNCEMEKMMNSEVCWGTNTHRPRS